MGIGISISLLKRKSSNDINISKNSREKSSKMSASSKHQEKGKIVRINFVHLWKLTKVLQQMWEYVVKKKNSETCGVLTWPIPTTLPAVMICNQSESSSWQTLGKLSFSDLILSSQYKTSCTYPLPIVRNICQK